MQKLMRKVKLVLSWSILAILGAVAAAGYASASTTGTLHYISSSTGSDSNPGTKASPWAHMPGMATCSANCASYTPQAGDQFVLYGGDTWTFTTAGTFSWSGTSGSHIEFGGLDTTWFNASACKNIGTVNTKAAGSLYSDQMNVRLGSATARGVTPQMVGTSGWTINGSGNYTITSRAFGANSVSFKVTPDPGTQSNVTMANSTGYYCQPRFDGANTLMSTCAASGGAACDFINVTGTYVEMDDVDIARWVAPNCNTITNCWLAFPVGFPNGNSVTTNVFVHDWINSASTLSEFAQWGETMFDSTTNTGAVCTQLNSLNGAVGGGCFIGGGGYNPTITTGSVCMWVADCWAGQAVGQVFAGSVGYDWHDSQDTNDHGNFIHDECAGYFYDNIGFGWAPNGSGVSGYLGEPLGACPSRNLTTYTWNNVMFGLGNQTCFEDRYSTYTYYHINDTCLAPGPGGGISSYAVRVVTDSASCPAAVHIINMHAISSSYSGSNSPVSYTGTSATYPIAGVDGGCTVPTPITITTSVPMSTATATSRGYTILNWLQPTSGSHSTVGVGTNETSLATGALASLAYALNTSAPGTYGTARPPTGNWDIGAYQISSSGGNPPAAPTGLTTVVH